MSKDCWFNKKFVKHPPKKKYMEDEWDAEVLCVLEKDKLVLVAMIIGHIDYENDLISNFNLYLFILFFKNIILKK